MHSATRCGDAFQEEEEMWRGPMRLKGRQSWLTQEFRVTLVRLIQRNRQRMVLSSLS